MRIYLPLPEDALAQLRDLAARERRRPRDQALVLVLEGLERARHASTERAPRQDAPSR